VKRSWLTDPIPFGGSLVWLAALLSVAAAAIHFAVSAEHFSEYPAYGVAFAALAWFQALWALAFLRRPTTLLAALAAVVNIGAIGVWIMSRTSGLPIAPVPWVPEPVGLSDTASSFLEAILVIALVTMRLPRLRGLPMARSTWPVVELLAVVFVTSLTAAVSLSPVAHANPGDQTAGHGAPSASGETSEHGEPDPNQVPVEAINFGSGLDASGQILDPTIELRVGRPATWSTFLASPVQTSEITIAIAKPSSAAADRPRWVRTQRVDPAVTRLTGREDLAALAGGSPGTYVFECWAAGKVIAASTFVIP
jgi:hypothetical protein